MTALGLRAGARLRLSPAGKASPALFVPARLPGLAFWYDAEASAYGDGIWRDLSGNNNDASQVGFFQRPIRTNDEAGRMMLRFDGLDDSLSVDNPPDLSAGATLYAVYRVRDPGDFEGIVSPSAATGVDHQQFFTLQYQTISNQRIQVFGRSLQANQIFAQAVDSTQKQYAIATFEGDNVTAEVRDLNGSVVDTSTSAPFGTPAVVVLGARFRQGAPFSYGAIDLYEVGLYSRGLDPSERDQLEAYLRQRHGITWNPWFIGGDLAWFHDVDASDFSLSGSFVDRWDDLTTNARHWAQSSSGRPEKTTDVAGRNVVRFDGIDDLMTLAGAMPPLEPFSLGAVYRVRDRGDFDGIVTALPPVGTDHTDFWAFRNTSAGSDTIGLFGRSGEADPLDLTIADTGDAQVALWTAAGGSAELRDGSGVISDLYGGAFGAPAEIVLGGRYGGSPFGYAAIDVLATIGAGRALSAVDQQRFVDWANAKWEL